MLNLAEQRKRQIGWIDGSGGFLKQAEVLKLLNIALAAKEYGNALVATDPDAPDGMAEFGPESERLLDLLEDVEIGDA